MIVKCPYCDYKKPDEPLSLPIVKATLDADSQEDYMLWFERLLRTHYQRYGTKSYAGVKVHIGRKHKGEYNMPTHEFNKQELKAQDEFAQTHTT